MAEGRDNLEGQILPPHTSDRALQPVRRQLNEPVCYPSFSPKALYFAWFCLGVLTGVFGGRGFEVLNFCTL